MGGLEKEVPVWASNADAGWGHSGLGLGDRRTPIAGTGGVMVKKRLIGFAAAAGLTTGLLAVGTGPALSATCPGATGGNSAAPGWSTTSWNGVQVYASGDPTTPSGGTSGYIGANVTDAVTGSGNSPYAE